MLALFFGDLFSTLTTVLVLLLLVFAVLALAQGSKISKWGRFIALFILVGTAISALSAIRDGYGTANALFAMEGLQSSICSIAGGLIFLIGIVSIFFKKQVLKRYCFHIISVLFVIQVIVIEASRSIYLLGGIA